MSLQPSEASQRQDPSVPNAMTCSVPNLTEGQALTLSKHLVRIMRANAPKASGRGAESIVPYSGPGFIGVRWEESYLWYQERGTRAHTMRSLAGKAQPLDEPILTPTGWTTMGALSVGDEVVGSDGKPTEVLGIYPQGVLDTYRITFNDGTSVRASGDHLWGVYRDGTNAEYRRTLRTATTEQIARTTGKRHPWSVPLHAAVVGDGVSRTLPLDPYIIGIMLSEGCRGSSPTFAQKQMPVVDEVRKVLPDGIELAPTTSRMQWRMVSGRRGTTLNPVSVALRELGMYQSSSSETGVRECPVCGITGTRRGPFVSSKAVMIHSGKAHGTRVPPRKGRQYGDYSYDKTIPDAVMQASVDDRLSVLQGLMDGDGSCPKQGGMKYSTSSYGLAEGVLSLVRSLGAVGKITSDTKMKEKFNHLMHTVYFNMPEGMIPFRAQLRKKLHRYLSTERRWGTKKIIVSVERDGVADMQCIRVSAGDSLYVTTGNTLTHNTIPMWINDPDGRKAQAIPVHKRNDLVRRTADGRQQVKIFRKAAPIGSRKWVERNGRMVNVPRSYPGAPGRITFRDQFGQVMPGNVGVRWRHPGMAAKDFMQDAFMEVLRRSGLDTGAVPEARSV